MESGSATLQENPEVVQRNQINNSKAKQQYSFPQSDRFNNSRMFPISYSAMGLQINSTTSPTCGRPREKSSERAIASISASMF